MKDLKTKELRDKTVPELEAVLREEKAALYKARRDLVFRQTTDTTGLKVRRHNIARLHTLIAEKKRGTNG
jgi:ribosomal protein L29